MPKLFDFITSVGVLHHLPTGPLAGLQALSRLLKPGGVLQLAMYSRHGTEGWYNMVREYMCSQLPWLRKKVRSPTKAELRAVRKNILALPLDHLVRRHLVQCTEFYSYTGCLDLLFHPCERSYTLLQVDGMLQTAQLRPIGVYFQDMEHGLKVRTAFCKLHHQPEDMKDLRKWHQFEQDHPDSFGRMHVIFCEKGCA